MFKMLFLEMYMCWKSNILKVLESVGQYRSAGLQACRIGRLAGVWLPAACLHGRGCWLAGFGMVISNQWNGHFKHVGNLTKKTN